MAKLYNNFTSDTLMSFGKSFSRLNGQPLDKSEIWFSFDEAQAYARTDAAYVSQKIAVIDTTAGTVTHYSIKNAAGDLEELGKTVVGDDLSVEISGKTLSLKNWGKKYYKYVPATESTPATYELTDGFMDGLEVKVRKTTRTNAAGDPEEVYELAYYQPNPTTVEGLQSALTAVQEAAQSAKDDAAGALTEAQKKISDVKGSGAVEATVDESKVATVKIKLDNSGNVQFSETATGLKAEVEMPSQAEYTIKKLDTASEGASASYRLTKDGTEVGAVIDIPKDMVVSSGTVETKTESGAWGDAGTYIVLTLANATSDTLYINVGTLIEYVTSGSVAGDMVFVTVDPLTHKVTATITDGTITKAKLTTEVQTLLDKAGTSVQSITVLGIELKDGNELTADQAKTALGLDAEGIAAYKQISELESTMDTKIQDALNWSSI